MYLGLIEIRRENGAGCALKSCLREISNHSYETHIVCVNCNDQWRQVPKITSKGIMPKHLKV